MNHLLEKKYVVSSTEATSVALKQNLNNTLVEKYNFL